MERSPSQDIIYVMRREPIPSVTLARIVTGLTDSEVVSRDPRRRPAGFEDAKRRLLGKELLNCYGSEVKIIFFRVPGDVGLWSVLRHQLRIREGGSERIDKVSGWKENLERM